MEKLYDLSSLEKICDGDKDFILKMVAVFCELVPQNVEKIKESWESKDYDTVGKTAHSMKPSLDQMGISTLYNPIREIEKVGKEEINYKKIDDLINELDLTIKKVTQHLENSYK